MNHSYDIDDQTLELIRRADPAGPDTDTPDLLDTDAALRIALAQIEDAERPRRRTRRAVRLGVAGVAAAGAAAIVLTSLPAGHSVDGLGPASAQAATVQQRALRAFTPAAGSILVVDAVSTQDNGDGTSASWRYQYWSASTYPYANRVIQTQAGSPTAESGMTSSGYQELYDSSTDTIYEYRPSLDVSPGAAAGTEILTVPSYQVVPKADDPHPTLPAQDHGSTQLTISDAQLAALRTGADEVGYGKAGLDGAGSLLMAHPKVVTNQGYAINPSSQWSDPIKALLHSPDSTVDRNATYHGTPAIEISATAKGLTTRYWVTRDDYRPLEEILTSPTTTEAAPAGAAAKVTTTTVTTRFAQYTVLSGPSASASLLSLSAQHPGAKLDTDPSDYSAAQGRLYPNG